jgi:3-oxoacyl-[acyl-carrier protein] reductase
MNKSEASSSYLSALQDHYGDVRRPSFPRVWINGTKRRGSIGAAIADRLDPRWGETDMLTEDHSDVTKHGHRLDASLAQHDTMIVCHGLNHLDWFEDAPMANVEAIFDVTLTGTYRVVQEFVRCTIERSVRKRIIIIGSMAYKKVLNGSAAYCAAKAGLSMLVKCMAWELAPKGYDVFIVHPSNVDGAPMAEDTIQGLMRYRDLSRAEAEAYWGDNYIRGKSLSTDEIAEMVHYLVTSPHVGYLSGTDLDLAGGQR